MSSKIINEQGAKLRDFLLYVLIIGTFYPLLFSSVASAATPANPHEQSVPVQLTLIRSSLDALSVQMSDMETILNDKLDTLQDDVSLGNNKLDTLQQSADDIYDAVTSVDITMTTTICFGVGVGEEYQVGVHGEFGVGWPNVLDVEASIQGDAGLGVGIGIEGQICIEVPLYSVASSVPLFTNNQEFDDLIAAIAMPSQNVVPLIGNIYGELMPTPDQTIEAIGNVIHAATGYDIGDGKNRDQGPVPDPERLARPDILLEPVIPDILAAFIYIAPGLIEDAINDPCAAFANTPLGHDIDPALYDWICDLERNPLEDIGNTLETIDATVETIVNTLGIGGSSGGSGSNNISATLDGMWNDMKEWFE